MKYTVKYIQDGEVMGQEINCATVAIEGDWLVFLYKNNKMEAIFEKTVIYCATKSTYTKTKSNDILGIKRKLK